MVDFNKRKNLKLGLTASMVSLISTLPPVFMTAANADDSPEKSHEKRNENYPEDNTTLKSQRALTKINFLLEAPSFSLADLSGNIHKSEDHQGKVVLLSFWASWCLPCRKELPSLARLSKKIPKEKVSIFAVNLGESNDKIERFLSTLDSKGLTILTNRDNSMKQQWYVNGLPLSYVLDKNGHIKLGAIGALDWDAPIIEKQLLDLAI